MKRKLIIIVQVFICNYYLTAGNINNTEYSSTVISNGFVFIDGIYIESPYIVSRKGLKLYINNRCITDYSPLVKIIPESGDVFPLVPLSITTNTSPNDKNIGVYLYKVQKYITSHYDYKQRVDKMEQVLKRLPCVKEVKRNDDGTSAKVVYFNGQIDNMTLVPPIRIPVTTNNTIIKYINQRCRYYERRLQKGDFYSFYAGGKYTFNSQIAIEELSDIVKNLQSSQDNNKKADKIAKLLGLSNVPKDKSESFIRSLSKSQQFIERVKALTENKIK